MNIETLIVDDDAIIRIVHQKVVTRTLPGTVKSFIHGLDALDYLIGNYRSDIKYLILLDLNMPVMNGWEFMDQISNSLSHENINVVVLSSSVEPSDKEKATEYGLISKYLEKPLTLDMVSQIHAQMTTN